MRYFCLESNNRVNSCCSTSEHRITTKQCQLNLFPSICFESVQVLSTASSSSSIVFFRVFLGISFLSCPWEFQLTISLFMAEESFLCVCPVKQKTNQIFKITVWPTFNKTTLEFPTVFEDMSRNFRVYRTQRCRFWWISMYDTLCHYFLPPLFAITPITKSVPIFSESSRRLNDSFV